MRIYIKIIIIVLLVLFLFGLASCDGDDSTTADESYVEVTGVRVPSAVVYLSPDGETSNFQLEPTVFPENATNRKILYYVSPENLDYFDVTPDGFITAKRITEEGSVPIKIISAANPDAYTIVSVIIEYVEVREIYFGSNQMDVLYNSDPVELDIRYSPYHAQDGRDVIFTSQNSEVATVDSSGTITIQDVGITTIIAKGTTLGGRTIEGRVQVRVAYSPGSYRLEVTNSAPRYEQVIGTPHTISFNIIRLDPHCDPNPDIKWKVEGNRILSQDGEWQFEYSPDEDSTPATFTITAELTPKAEQTIVLESEPITLYKEFTGFELLKNEPTGTKYEYNSNVIFDPEMEEAERFEWYIKSQGETGVGNHIGTTLYSQNYGEYSMTMEDEGAFTITVSGYDEDVEINRRSFDFNVIRYVSGDRVQILPQITTGEKIPESFDWYLHEYDSSVESDNIEDKLVNIDGSYVGTSVGDEPFHYETSNPGTYVLSSTPTLDGLPVTIIEDGQSYRMIEYTEPFTVWEKEDRPKVSYLIVDGVMVDEEDYRPLIKWGQLGGINNYVIEVFSNNRIYLIDTLEQDFDDTGIIYRDYSIVLPPEIATFSQDFSVRVKKQGGVYCDSVVYEADTISSANYNYLDEINFSINQYISDMYEMGEIINYVSVYRPESLLKNQDDGFMEFAIRIQTPIVYNQLDGVYPVHEETEYEENHLVNIYNIVHGAYNAYGIADYIDFDFEYFDIDKSFEITITVPDNIYSYSRQKGEGVNNYDFMTNYSTVGREGYDDFSIKTKETINVRTSSELYYVVSLGKRPMPVEDSIAEEIYEEALSILNEILAPNMKDFEKMLAIYDYLVENVEYDKPLYQYSLMYPEPEDLYLHAGYHLEGVVLDKKGLSPGVSKALNLLLWIEGISSYSVEGNYGDKSHTWNKVLIGNEWYNIDASKGKAQRDNGSVINHMYFLFSDTTAEDLGYETFGQYPDCNIDYEKHYFVSGYEFITQTDQLNDLIQFYATRVDDKPVSFQIEVDNELFDNDIQYRDFILSGAQAALEETDVGYKELFQFKENFFVLVIEPIV